MTTPGLVTRRGHAGNDAGLHEGFSLRIKRTLSAVAVGAVGVGLLPVLASPALADTKTQLGFESFSTGSPNGQGGWQVANPAFDYSIVNPSAAWPSGTFGTRALRMSNAVTSGSFGDQLFSVQTGDEAGETSAASDGYSGGTRQQRFTASFLFGSADPTTYQNGLVMGVSPDRGDGARMGLVRLYDLSDGLKVTVWSYDQATENFSEHTVASGLNRTQAHRLVMTEDFVDGEDNDVFTVSVDDAAPVHGTSWEQYFRHDPESTLNGTVTVPTRTVDSLLFRSSIDAPVPSAVLGKGFLVDNVVLTTGPATPATGSTVVWNQNSLDAGDFTSVNDTFSGASSASAKFVTGPGTAPLGLGSYQLSTGPVTGSNNGKRYVGKPMTGSLSSLTALSYSSWVSPSNATNAQPYVNVTFNGGGGYGNLVYDPIDPANGPQTKGVWRQQNAFSPTAIWTATRNVPGISKGTRATWADFMAAMPTATFYPVVGGVYLVAGSTGTSPMWTDFVGAVDALSIGVDGDTTTYDFDNWEQCPSTTDIPGKTVTLTGDCTTSETLHVADGWTLDGAEHTITAVDTLTGPDFTGPVLTNESVTDASMDVKNLHVVGNFNDGCSSSLFGVRFNNASGSITHSTIANIRYGAGSGCQSGNSLDITNLGGATRLPVTVDDVAVTGFQKTGIRANGNVALTLKHSSVADAELDMVTASNSLQISRGARAYVSGNTFGGNDWDGNNSTGATGALLYGAGDVTFTRNVITGDDTDFGLYAYEDSSFPAGQLTLTCNLVERSAGADTTGGALDLWNTGVVAEGTLAGSVTAAGNTVTGFATQYDGVTNEVGGPCASGPVSDLALDATSTSLDVSWTAPTAMDYAPVTGYDVTLVPGGTVQHVTGTSASFTGLSAAKEYTVTVVPVNAAGNGTAASGSGATAPGDASITATDSTQNAVSVEWTVPGSEYSGFDVVISDDGGEVDSVNAPGDARSWVFTGLDADTEYVVTVTPHQGARDGGEDSATVSTLAAPVIVQAPAAVTGLTAGSSSVGSLTVGWSAAPTATGYDVTLLPGGTIQHVTGTSANFTGLSPSRAYTVTVVATNAAGSGPARSASLFGAKVTPSATPKTVTSGKASTVTGKVVDDAGAPVAGQTITLYSRVKGSATYKLAGVKATTAANGTFTFKVRPSVTKRFYVMTSGTGHMAANSSSFVVKARGVASIKLSKSSVTKGQKVTFSGSVRPRTAVTVELQRKVGSRWVTVRTTTSSSKGAYAVAFTPQSTTDYAWRVRVSGPTFSPGTSKSVVLHVT